MNAGVPATPTVSGVPGAGVPCASAPSSVASVAAPAFAHRLAGPIDPPVPVPDVAIAMHDGRRPSLRAVLAAPVTAVQYVFTGCSSVCPVQGALFAELQPLLDTAALKHVRLLSIGIDPLGDTPQALREWLRRFDAGPRWAAGAPSARGLAEMQSTLQLSLAGEAHATQVDLFDRDARLVWRSTPLPPPAEVMRAVGHFVRASRSG